MESIQHTWFPSWSSRSFSKPPSLLLSAWPIVLVDPLEGEGAVCVSPLLTGHLVPASIPRSRWPGTGVGSHMSRFWLGMNTCCACCSPKGALDTSLTRLPHTTAQPLVQTPGQPPGLGQRPFVCPCLVEASRLASSIRKRWPANHASSSSQHVLPIFLTYSLRCSKRLRYPPRWRYPSPKPARFFFVK